MAGTVFGYAYQKTQRIEASILCHFGVNTFHFIFLTYPALANKWGMQLVESGRINIRIHSDITGEMWFEVDKL